MTTESSKAYRTAHPLANTWYCLKARCYNPNNPKYPDYGGRGIGVHPPWLTGGFQAFEAWIHENLGPRPEGASLDRVDNDGNYEPGNLRWASDVQQAQNRRNILSRRLPLGVVSRKDGFTVHVAGFPDLESAKRAAETARGARDEALNRTSNRDEAA